MLKKVNKTFNLRQLAGLASCRRIGAMHITRERFVLIGVAVAQTIETLKLKVKYLFSASVIQHKILNFFHFIHFHCNETQSYPILYINGLNFHYS